MKNKLRNLFHAPLFWIAAIYLICPVDLIPDPTPYIGIADDALVIMVCAVVNNIIKKK